MEQRKKIHVDKGVKEKFGGAGSEPVEGGRQFISLPLPGKPSIEPHLERRRKACVRSRGSLLTPLSHPLFRFRKVGQRQYRNM